MLWFNLSSHPNISASPSIAFCPFLSQAGWQAWKFNGLEEYMHETISVGFLKALTWANCSNSFFSSPLHRAIRDCHVTLRYSLHSRFDTKSLPHCSSIGENLPTLLRANLGYRYGYDMVPELILIDWFIDWLIYIRSTYTGTLLQETFRSRL